MSPTVNPGRARRRQRNRGRAAFEPNDRRESENGDNGKARRFVFGEENIKGVIPLARLGKADPSRVQPKSERDAERRKRGNRGQVGGQLRERRRRCFRPKRFLLVLLVAKRRPARGRLNSLQLVAAGIFRAAARQLEISFATLEDKTFNSRGIGLIAERTPREFYLQGKLRFAKQYVSAFRCRGRVPARFSFGSRWLWFWQDRL